MGTKVKGLLRSFRYISQIFEENEPEMQIGHPTDVKHVAHIGWDGPDASRPSWMNEFKAPAEISSEPLNSTEEEANHLTRLPSEAENTSRRGKKKHGPRNMSTGCGSPLDSPTQKSSDTPKHSRRHRSLNVNVSPDSPTKDSSGSIRSSRQHQSQCQGIESPVTDQPSIPKHSSGRKSKGSSRKSRSREQNVLAEAFAFAEQGSEGSQSGHGKKNNASHLTSVLEAKEKGERKSAVIM